MSFAPGHISLTFAIHNNVDPLKMGSTGLGIVLPKGVYCSIVDENNEGERNKIIIENENFFSIKISLKKNNYGVRSRIT